MCVTVCYVCMHVCVCLCLIPNHADYDIVIFIAGVRVSDAIFHGLVKYKENVNVMALTATATRTTRNDVIKSLDMQSPVIVSISPMKDNIFYCVSPKASIPSSFGPLADRLAAQRTSMDRIIIFCRTYDEVTEIYYFLKMKLRSQFTEPPGAPDLSRFRLVDMYTHCTNQTVKDTILARFTSAPASASSL